MKNWLLYFKLQNQTIIVQQLIPKKFGEGRVIACEVMIPNPAIRNLIREAKIQQIYSSMQTGQRDHGMQTLAQDLVRLVKNDTISMEEALARVSSEEEFATLMAKSTDHTKRR